eukprot:scaffold32004_cov37-Cyclotella_meneghiniana.AAC.2
MRQQTARADHASINRDECRPIIITDRRQSARAHHRIYAQRSKPTSHAKEQRIKQIDNYCNGNIITYHVSQYYQWSRRRRKSNSPGRRKSRAQVLFHSGTIMSEATQNI